jgi:hypothetical protein
LNDFGLIYALKLLTLAKYLAVTTLFQIGNSSLYYSHTKNQVNISNHSGKKAVTTKYLAKFQSPMAVSWPKIIHPE